MLGCQAKGKPVPDQMVQALADSSGLIADPPALRQRFQDDGYLFLKGALDRDEVLAARAEILARLTEVGEVVPGSDGVFTGTSRRKEIVGDLGRFWKSVSEGENLRRVSHGPGLKRVLERLIGAPARPQDYLFLRAGVVGRATGLHYDYPFFTRAHDQVYTVWVPIGDVPVADGPLVVVEGSNRFRDLIDPMIGFDVVKDTSRKADLGEDPVALAMSRGTRLRTADFEAGDIALFGMFTAHGSFDNHSPENRVRLSCDVRWQPADLPVDARYFGPDPAGTTGAGYAELNGAKPLDQPWHIR
ncbi:MAG: phytanoyl-CoA dioxygenase family protein [Proteobacteria bacterium]|nr:phytanoyl-CoA dioxygenase family protein [Pseudomonadota bacterium]MBI3498078.1 phytanoyl-CoA dioxygenase family protein [Pseudomonadota bacterium]